MSDPAAPPRPTLPAPLVAVAGWLLPGAGHVVIGQWVRGATIGTCVLGLFVLGLLVGGVRVVEVPGYNSDTGQRQLDPATRRWALTETPFNEVRAKPWSVPQAMAGPVAFAAAAASVYAAQGDPAGPLDGDGRPKVFPRMDFRRGQAVQPIGGLTHARMNEIPSLYLSVAGLLNLMAVVDAAHRSVHLAERRRDGAA